MLQTHDYQSLEHAINGRLAVAVIRDSGQVISEHRSTESFSSASLIKVSLAWQWLEQQQLDGLYQIQASDICDAEGSLVHQIGQHVPTLEIARRMITESENNATNLVLDWVGGMDVANRWLEQRGWSTTRWERRMLDWQARALGCDNRTTAWSCAQQLWHLQRSPAWAARMVYQWMLDSIRDNKLERGLRVDQLLAHKVGDLPGGIEHDMGIVYDRNGHWYIICVLMEGQAPIEQLRQSIGEISRAYTNLPNA